MEISFLITGFLLFALLLSYWNRWLASPIVAIANRWIRWIFFSLAFAELIRFWEFTDRPFWTLAVIGFLLWFLIESLYTWFAIGALSLSPIPIFPRFEENSTGEEWPAQKRMMMIRDWLRAEKYVCIQPLIADVGTGVQLRLSVYHDPKNLFRVQVLFIPLRNGNMTVCFNVSSETQSGLRYLTDNLFLPFGGFYPEKWSVKRKPWVRSLSSLVSIHRKRMEKDKEVAVPWDSELIEDLNSQQKELDKVNTDLGFLFPYHMREEHGKMTWEGRYRIWTEIWLLNYLGVSRKY
jgi:hypothetical protein